MNLTEVQSLLEGVETNWSSLTQNNSFRLGIPRFNESIIMEPEEEYIFDRYYVQVIFIILYSIVFFLCVVGNSVVLLVVTLHWKMRHITKLCLANLAFADLCVGIFCVYQNLSTYLIRNWVLGEFLCKMYQFINSLSHTASILTLVVVCVERYLAILHPLKCRRILTKSRLRLLIVAVWISSGLYCSPRLVYMVTLRVPRDMEGLEFEIICTARRTLYDSRTFDMINSILLFVTPLVLMSVLYSRVGLVLWRSTDHKFHFPWSPVTRVVNYDVESIEDREESSITNPQQDKAQNGEDGDSLRSSKCSSDGCHNNISQPRPNSNGSCRRALENQEKSIENLMEQRGNKSSEVVISSLYQGNQKKLRSRQSVVKMLIVIVVIFMLCHLPFHLRKLAVYWKSNFQFGSIWNTLFLAISHLCLYLNCAVNPIIYSFMSRRFRESLRDLLWCKWRRRYNHSGRIDSNNVTRNNNNNFSIRSRRSNRGSHDV